jgi:hypothetical protein
MACSGEQYDRIQLKLRSVLLFERNKKAGEAVFWFEAVWNLTCCEFATAPPGKA